MLPDSSTEEWIKDARPWNTPALTAHRFDQYHNLHENKVIITVIKINCGAFFWLAYRNCLWFMRTKFKKNSIYNIYYIFNLFFYYLELHLGGTRSTQQPNWSRGADILFLCQCVGKH